MTRIRVAEFHSLIQDREKHTAAAVVPPAIAKGKAAPVITADYAAAHQPPAATNPPA